MMIGHISDSREDDLFTLFFQKKVAPVTTVKATITKNSVTSLKIRRRLGIVRGRFANPWAGTWLSQKRRKSLRR